MGVLFDMDGVLIDSNKAHFQSWTQVSREYGVDFPKELFLRTFGMTSEHIVANYWGANPPSDPAKIAEIVDRKEGIFREQIGKTVEAIPGAVDFVRYLAERGVNIAVGSSAPRVNVLATLEWLGILDLLGGVVAGTDVKEGKPAPDIFLTAAEKIGEKASDCVVIDDARSGVLAGNRSGAKTVGFFSFGHTPDEYETADVVVESFDELKPLLEIDANGKVRPLF